MEDYNLKNKTTYTKVYKLNRNSTSTDNGLKRKSTYIKRAGTEAWRWLSAEDSIVSEDQPVGVSFYQRNNTLRQLKSINNNPQSRLSGNDMSQFINQSYFKNLTTSEQSYTSVAVEELENEDVKRPEPAVEKAKNESNPNKRKNLKLPSILYDPDVRKQLRQMKRHTPYFMVSITIIQIVVLIFSIAKNYASTGRVIANLDENPMIGPYPSTLINMGARFLPCMQKTNLTELECPPGISSSRYVSEYEFDEYGQLVESYHKSAMCSIADICGFEMREGDKPNQWYRFIIPIFLHAGVIHLLFNLIFQIRTGIPMEKEFGSWRMFIIYMISGIFGFIFEAKAVGYSPSVGCSGALYGLLSCLLLDLIQSWKIIIKPWKELFKLLAIIIVSLGFGLIPYIDNFAHIGGFIMGLLMGLIFLPFIIFSKKGLIIKRVLMILSVFVAIFLFIWALRHFYIDGKQCKWCRYLSCIPLQEGWCDYASIY